jgi:uncharacterized protein (DUF58 family)
MRHLGDCMFRRLANIFAEIDREAWIRFFAALLGLVFSMAFAILSSSFREEGNVLATGITASLALLTAAAVGITSVPYLAKRVAFEGLRFKVRYEPTGEGAAYIAVVTIIGIAALNTGNNLLYIVVAAMLAAVLVSGVASTLVLRNLSLDVAIPEHVFAKKPFIGTITVRNQGRLPSFSISVVPEKPQPRRKWKWQPASIGFPPKREPEKQWIRVPDLQLRSVPPQVELTPILATLVYFPFLPPRHNESAQVELNFPKRGRYAQQALGLSTRFPFSFLKKTRVVPFERELIVLPAIEETEEFLSILPTLRGEFEAFVAGRGNDLYRLREFAPGDAARHIDWKATARAQSVIVREFTREDERKLRIVFDNPVAGSLSPAEYERAVSLAASLTWSLSDGVTELAFHAPGYRGAQETLEFLRYLAIAEPAREAESLDGLIAPGGYNLVITARPRGMVPTQLWNSSYFVFLSRDDRSA